MSDQYNEQHIMFAVDMACGHIDGHTARKVIAILRKTKEADDYNTELWELCHKKARRKLLKSMKGSNKK
jgi:hypothetical protein|tara:strand:- start:2930 stop:3136 length:207 start_codon:yes stop_codon:yes gene_type:complete